MAERKGEEKRTSVRADLATRVKVQPVSREEFELSKAARIGNVPGDVSADEGNLSDRRLGYLFDRMNRIEDKLDRILQKLDPEHGEAETTCYGVAQNVSGAGINLILEDAFEEGQLVLITLSVPGFSIGFLQAYGEVVRVVQTRSNERKSFETSIKFIVISEEEREKLISYAFRIQRQAIRDSILAKEENQDLPKDDR